MNTHGVGMSWDKHYGMGVVTVYYEVGKERSRCFMNSHRLIALLVLAACIGYADNYTWNSTSGSFQDTAHWTPATGVPGVSDKALFPAGTYAVGFDANVTNKGVTVGPNVTVDFNLGGYTWQLTEQLLFASGAGTVRFGNGTLEMMNYNDLASLTPGANQRLILDSGTSIFNGYVSIAGGGVIEANNGDHTMRNGLDLNAAPAGGYSLRITNGTVTVEDNSLAIDRRLTALASSKIRLEGGLLNVKTTTDFYGNTLIDVFTNATFTTAGVNFSRTAGQMATLNILGGSVSNSNIGMGMTINQTQPSTGMVWLADGNWYAGAITLGSLSNSVALVRQSGGRFETPSVLWVATGVRSLGIYTQEAGTAKCSGISMGSGLNSTGEFVMVDGAVTVQNNINLGNGNGGFGRFSQSGGSVVCQNISVGYVAGGFGSFSMSSGSVSCTKFSVVTAAGATGEVSLIGGTLTASATSYIGEKATPYARMVQSGGDFVVSGQFIVGNEVGSQGVFTNTGGRVRLTSDLYVGNAGDGRMFFNGASLFTPSTIRVGNYTSSTGELTIAGGQNLMTNTTLLIANQGNSYGTVTISGGTNLFHTLSPGSYGNGRLRIEGGYTETTNRSIVGSYSPSTSRVELVGGVLAVGYIDGRTADGYSNYGYSELLFDGGTLRHAGNLLSDFIFAFNKVNLTGRGAVIDTFGVNLSVPQAMSNETGHAGSFTKTGTGVLTLSSLYNAFTGRITVQQGELTASGAIYLTGGVVVEPGGLLTLTSATVRDAMTASGTVSRIDGTLRLKAGGVLTNGVGASLCGGGVITGSVVFATGSTWTQDTSERAGYTHPLYVTGNTVFEAGTSVALTGYTEDGLKAGVPLIEAIGAGSIQMPAKIPVTLNGVSHPYWRVKLSNNGKSVSAAYIPMGTMIRLL